MKSTSRRNFVKLAGTGRAGATLTPPLLAQPSEAARRQVMNMPASGIGLCASSLRITPPAGSKTDIFLSPQALSMPRPRIAFRGRLRLFSLRGSTSFRPRTVTGLKAMVYPPLNLSDPQITPPLGLFEGSFFNLSFREQHTGTLVQDRQQATRQAGILRNRHRSRNLKTAVAAATTARHSLCLNSCKRRAKIPWGILEQDE